ncbi:helix-turn-helix domain-containing protein [Maritimibacter alkaliphilus]|jgi:transcriptional regulator with XRE-family HTH domain|uniref:helix-turn-helix domain-containing protein n=1 Tax=Maritimibacter alkaliphilus TaxID=404236 RepID=UPI00032605F7|nr:helix-turn-helix transcriptional regulator [Maritimibacter alkaliphilus]
MANFLIDEHFAICEQFGMDSLARYLREGSIRQRVFAEQIGCSSSYLSEILSGRKIPSLTLAFAIERETKGAVPASSWVKNAA